MQGHPPSPGPAGEDGWRGAKYAEEGASRWRTGHRACNEQRGGGHGRREVAHSASAAAPGSSVRSCWRGRAVVRIQQEGDDWPEVRKVVRAGCWLYSLRLQR